MKKLKRFWENIPRKVRICLNILAILALLAADYVLLGCPALSPEQHFRRLEKSNLVGPAQIVESFEVPNGSYDHVIVADDRDAVILYCCNLRNYRWDKGTFIYRENEDGITVLPAPVQDFSFDARIIDLPILLFHDYPNAVRAELELTLGESLGLEETVWEQGGVVTTVPFEKTYQLEADREIGGYFRFNLHTEPEGEYVIRNGIEIWEPYGKETHALRIFSRMISETRAFLTEYVPATVRLYDRGGNLIAEETLTIRSVAGERYNDEN